VQTPFAVAPALAQVVQMSHGDPSQPRVFAPTVELNLALQNAPCCRTTQSFVRLIDRGKQLDVRPRVALRETVPPVDGGHDLSFRRVASDQPRNLRTAQAGHLLHVAPYQASCRL